MSDQLEETQRQTAHFELVRWLNEGVFTWQWWFLLASLVIPWILMLLVIDRKRAHAIWLYGLTVLIVSSFVDDLGSETGAWVYPVKLVPYSLIEFPLDFCVIPVAQMLIFQYFKTWPVFSAALTAQAILFAFIGEPFAVWARTITYYGWNYGYSFLFYMVTGILTRIFVQYWEPGRETAL